MRHHFHARLIYVNFQNFANLRRWMRPFHKYKVVITQPEMMKMFVFETYCEELR